MIIHFFYLKVTCNFILDFVNLKKFIDNTQYSTTKSKMISTAVLITGYCRIDSKKEARVIRKVDKQIAYLKAYP